MNGRTFRMAAGLCAVAATATAAKVNTGDIVIDVQSGSQTDSNTYVEGVSSWHKTGAGTVRFTNTTFQAWTTPMEIDEGTVEVFSPNVVLALCASDTDPKKFSQININDGGTLAVLTRNSTGNPNSGSGVKVHLKKGGTLQVGPDPTNGNSVNTFRELWLDGGVVSIQQAGAADVGCIAVQSLLKLTGDTPYTFSRTADETARFFAFGAVNYATEFCTVDIADVTGDERPDLTIAMPIGRAQTAAYTTPSKITYSTPHERPVNIVKIGKGTMRLDWHADASIQNGRYGVNGDIVVREGKLEFSKDNSLVQSCPNTITVKSDSGDPSDAVLHLPNLTTHQYNVDATGHSTTKFVIDHGSLWLGDLTATKPVGSFWRLGDELVLDHADVRHALGRSAGVGAESIGLVQVGRLVELRGGEPFSFLPYDTDTLYLDKPEDEFKRQRMHLDDRTTEFRVADVTGDERADMTIGYQLDDFFWYRADRKVDNVPLENILRRGHLLKTGAGTLCLTNHAGRFSGNVTVREGTLRIEPNHALYDSKKFGSQSSSFIGAGAAGTELLVTTNGTLDIFERCAIGLYTYGYSGGCLVKRTIRLDGGKLLLRRWPCTLATSLTVENGAKIDYSADVVSADNQHRNNGPFSFLGTMTVQGDTPFTLDPAPEGRSIIVLYPDYQCTFDVKDVTGDLRSDFISGLTPSGPDDRLYVTDGKTGDQVTVRHQYGFVKKGAGTMSLETDFVEAVRSFDLPAKIEEGAMLVNSDQHTAAAFNVSAGASIGGTGRVSAVNLEAGACLQADLGQRDPLDVDAEVAIPASGTIVIRVPADVTDEQLVKLPSTRIVKSAVGLKGAENLANWTISVPGHEEFAKTCRLSCDGRSVVMGCRGLMLLIR